MTQSQALDILKMGRNVFITGPAGSGKTYVINQYITPQELDNQKLVYGAAEGLVRSVGDPYTVFMAPKETVAFRESLNGTLEGIGAELKEKDHLITVAAPIKGSPAEKAGLLPEDIIAEVNGESMEGKSLNQAVEKIRGPSGTQVTLVVYRASSTTPVTLKITRAAISIPSVTSKVITTAQGPIGYVDLTQFGDRSMDEVRSALDTFKTQKLKDIEGMIEAAKPAVLSISKGDLVELISGPFKGEKARVIKIDTNKDEVTVELTEVAVPIPVTIKATTIKVFQKASDQAS
jgi:carboxyl-terminal processing protease